MTNLNEVVQGLNKYCGPAVLSILTGKSTDECANAISKVSGQKIVRAAQTHHILKALDNLGFDNNRKPLIARTLYGCLCALVNFDGFYLIVVPEHIVAIQIKDKQIYFCDNHTGAPIKAEASARLTQEVQEIWHVKERPAPPKPAVHVPTPEELNRKHLHDLEDQVTGISREIERLKDKRTQLEQHINQLRMAGVK